MNTMSQAPCVCYYTPSNMVSSVLAKCSLTQAIKKPLTFAVTHNHSTCLMTLNKELLLLDICLNKTFLTYSRVFYQEFSNKVNAFAWNRKPVFVFYQQFSILWKYSENLWKMFPCMIVWSFNMPQHLDCARGWFHQSHSVISGGFSEYGNLNNVRTPIRTSVGTGCMHVVNSRVSVPWLHLTK